MVQQEESVVGFDDVVEDHKLSSKKKKDLNKKKGGFYNLGLSFEVLKGIQKRGYKTPTPIQRKTIPLIMEGRDVVAMARTGSGKTACFLIPLFEKLKYQIMGKSGTGIRGLILSPTRELALQTLKFVKEIGKFTGLKATIVLGGDAMETQFSAIHNNPDIIVATPGRFLHVCVEMELKLNKIEYIVFDEADRLFEMGFGEQLREIVHRLPENRQTLLFSATLPKVLVEFARAGLNDPVLLRLDVESKLPDTLDLSFISCRSDDKPAALLCLLKQLITDNSLTLIFAATKHHVEYLHYLLDKAGIENTYIYSDLAPSARKINAAKFQTCKVRVLVVTDVAARGIDIPHLDYVINYNFPAKAKLFVHRVGRCARAGRKGTAFSLISNDELCYLIDLHLFLGRPLSTVNTDGSGPPDAIGRIPQSILEDELSQVISLHETYADVSGQFNVSENAYKQYLRSRPGASVESVKRVKQFNLSAIGIHHAFSKLDKPELDKANFLAQMKKYRPQGTVFEIGLGSHSEMYNVMKIKRHRHSEKINKHRHLVNDEVAQTNGSKTKEEVSLESSDATDIKNTFRRVIIPGKRKLPLSEHIPKKKKCVRSIDSEHFIPYKPADQHTEEGLAVDNFQHSASKVMFDLTGDTENALKKSGKARMVWDKKKKRMVGVNSDSKVGKIKSESGAWIPATYKSGRYKNWVERNKAGVDQEDSDLEDNKRESRPQPHTHWGRHNMKVKQRDREMKNSDQILKQRMIEEKKKKKNARKSKKHKRKTK